MMPAIVMGVKLFINDDPREIARSRKALLGMMHALMYTNITWLLTYNRTPPLYRSGVRYEAERSQEHWRDIPTIMEHGVGDCEDLACWRAAELNVAGIRAKPYLKWRNSGPDRNMYHATLRLPDGRIEDPSAALGMNGAPIIAVPVFVDPGPMT